MDRKIRNYNQRFLASCAVLMVLALIGLMALMTLIAKQNRQIAQFPDSQPIASHSNYSRFPTRYKWDDSYLTNASFTEVYNWYSITFDMGAEARAEGRCIWLESHQERWIIQRSMGVFLCDTPKGRMIFVSQTTWYQ
jgi:hypothetical protein